MYQITNEDLKIVLQQSAAPQTPKLVLDVLNSDGKVIDTINTIISGKKMEQTVMNIMPFGMIIYLRITSPEFIEPLYGNLFGAAVMSVCLVVYAAAFMLGRKITDIKV